MPGGGLSEIIATTLEVVRKTARNKPKKKKKRKRREIERKRSSPSRCTTGELAKVSVR